MKLRIIARLYLLVITLFLLPSLALAVDSKVGAVTNGNFDASINFLDAGHRLEIKGEWCFNWQEFISPDSVCPSNHSLLLVPSKWNKLGEESFPRQGYASYSVHIQLPESDDQLALYVPTLYRAASIWFNGELVKRVGKPGTTREAETPSDAASIIEIPKNLTSVDLVIHVSSFSHIDGGINQPIEIALLKDLLHYERIRSFSSVLLVGSSISFALYFLVIGLRGSNKIDWVYITGAATIMALTLRVIGVEQIWLMLYPNADANWILRFEYYGLYFALPACLTFLYNLFPKNTNLKVIKFVLVLSACSTLITTFTPSHIYTWLRDPWVLIYPFGFLYIIYVVSIAVVQQRQYAKIIGILMCVIVLTTLNDYLIWFQVFNGRSLVNITYLAMISGNVLVLIIRLVRSSRTEELLIDQINELNVNLQSKVDQRTSQLSAQQLVLENQNKKLLEMDKLKSQFLANISHEFRTPLTLIKGPLNRLVKGELGELSGDAAKAVETSSRNAGRLSRLMEELLTLSHLESNRLKLQVQSVEINSFCRRIASMFEHQAQERDLVFSIELLAEDTVLFFDPSKMETVLCNLLSNAFKYTPRQGHVSLILQPPTDPSATEPMMSFIIRDTGPGIPEALRTRIFDRFYRLEQHDRSSVEGSGIGLSLVKELTELHGGGVSVLEPKLEGVDSSGSEFIVQLPVGFQHFEKDEFSTRFSELPTPNLIQTPNSDVSKRSHSNHTHKTLLLVEDVHDMREYIADHFRSEYNVLTAGDGQQAWDILQHKDVDIVLTDLMMPIMDGLELLEKIRCSEQLQQLPVLMLTARSDREDRNAALTQQASDYLAKPFDSDELVLRVRNLAQGAVHKNSEEPMDVTVSADQKLLKEAKRLVLEHLSDTLFDTKQLASALNMSKPTFHRHLDKAANTTPAAFIRDIRLDQAHQLIEAQTYRTIAEVAFAVGFSSPGYFSRLYKQRYT